MGILRDAFASPPAGYGQPGAGKWEAGMSWSPAPNSWAGAGTPTTSMQMSAVFGALRTIGEPVATMPLDVFQPAPDGGRTTATPPDYLQFDLPGISRINYLSQVILSLLTDGNAMVATPRGALAEVLALRPLDPTKITCGTDRRGLPIYRTTFSGDVFNHLDIMHIPGMMLPGQLRGVSPLEYARRTVSFGLQAQEYGDNFFENNAMPPGVMTVPGVGADDEVTAKRIKRAWDESHAGPANAGSMGVLLGGADIKALAISNADAEWLESRQFGIQEIARFYGIPPHLLADSSNSTSWGSGLAEQNTAFGQLTLRPWVERIEEAHNRLLTTDGRRAQFVKLNIDAALRASPKERFEVYEIGIRNKILVPNEARVLEDLPKTDWGDEPLEATQAEAQVPPPAPTTTGAPA